MSRSLHQKSILITGGAGLLGVEHCVAVAEAGARAIIVDLDRRRLEMAAADVRRRTGADVVTKVCDITSLDAVQRLKAEVGPIDGLVNNAAINPTMMSLDGAPAGAFENYPLADWNREIAVGLTGAMLCCQVFGAAMAKRQDGSIVNIASDLGVVAPDHRIYAPSRQMEKVTSFKPVSYSVTKTALLGLTKYVATYWAHRGVRCNALAPGAVLNGQPETLVDGLKDRIPMGRLASPTEYHGALVFLLSEASAYMTGQTLVLDGGRSAW